MDRSYACIAPVGGHTCITAGERSEPAGYDDRRIKCIGPRRRTHNNQWLLFGLTNKWNAT